MLPLPLLQEKMSKITQPVFQAQVFMEIPMGIATGAQKDKILQRWMPQEVVLVLRV